MPVPDESEFPGEVAGVAQSLVDGGGAECAQQVRGVPGEQHPPRAPPPGEAVVDGVHAGVEEFVRRGRAVGPAREGGPDARHQRFGGDEFAAGRQQPVDPPAVAGERAGGDLGAGAAPRRIAVQDLLAGERQRAADRGHGVPFDGGAAGEADVEEFADGGAGAVAADQVAAVPRRCARSAGGTGRAGGGGPAARAGAGGDPVAVLFDLLQAGAGDETGQRFAVERLTQGAGEGVLRQVEGAGSASSKVWAATSWRRRSERTPVSRVPPRVKPVPARRAASAAVSSRRTTVRAQRSSSGPVLWSRTTVGTSWRASASDRASPAGPAPTMITGSTGSPPGGLRGR